mgnify:CR=1 FL=1
MPHEHWTGLSMASRVSLDIAQLTQPFQYCLVFDGIVHSLIK